MSIIKQLVLANILLISVAWATTFQPLPVEKLIAPADAILLGDFLTSKTVELEDGTLATEARFKIEKELGLDAEDFGLSEIKVFYPGGKRGDKVVTVEGAPSFVPGEKNVVLLSLQADGRLWVQGLAMGTFVWARRRCLSIQFSLRIPKSLAKNWVNSCVRSQILRARVSKRFTRINTS
jgi:hypothetical protein